jgi:methylphosphotriester-DNA--protein-cysteine methyltransferase
LNCVRQELQSNKTFADCVQSYGYQSPDQLYRAYRRLFAEEPPLTS